jgi:hypothetical protein
VGCEQGSEVGIQPRIFGLSNSGVLSGKADPSTVLLSALWTATSLRMTECWLSPTRASKVEAIQPTFLFIPQIPSMVRECHDGWAKACFAHVSR